MQSIQNLKALFLVSETDMPCYIPKDLPKLEELVLFVKGSAEVSFEDPVALFSAIMTFYILGQPITTTLGGSDLDLVLHSLARRDLCLSTVSATSADQWYRHDSSCMYVRPIIAREVPFEVLYAEVNRLVGQCGCGACFKCLREAGCLTDY